MNRIQNSCIAVLTPVNKTITGLVLALAISAIALSIIGLTGTPSGPFNVIVQLGPTTHQIILGASIFVGILDLIWIATLCKKKKVTSVSLPALLPQKEDLSVDPSNPFYFLPADVQKLILKQDAITLGKFYCVDRRLSTLASQPELWNALNLRNIHPQLKVFDKSDWETHFDLTEHGLEIENETPFNNFVVIPAIMKRISSLEIEGNAGVTLLTIPKGLSLNLLNNHAPMVDVSWGQVKMFSISQKVLNKFGNCQANKTYRVLVTNNVFSESRDLSITQQRSLINAHGWGKPKAMEITALLALSFIKSGVRLYPNTQPRNINGNRVSATFTYCEELVSEGRLCMGTWDFSYPRVDIYGRLNPKGEFGIGGRWEIPISTSNTLEVDLSTQSNWTSCLCDSFYSILGLIYDACHRRTRFDA